MVYWFYNDVKQVNFQGAIHVTQLKQSSKHSQLISDLRQMGINDDGILTRLIAEGYTPRIAKNMLQLPPVKPNSIERNGWLTTWLILHILIVVFAILVLTITLNVSQSYPDSFWLPAFLLIDAYIQLGCMDKLWHNKIEGFYGLMILFVLQLIFISFFFPFTLIDAILLCITVYSSRTKPKSERTKAKHKSIA